MFSATVVYNLVTMTTDNSQESPGREPDYGSITSPDMNSPGTNSTVSSCKTKPILYFILGWRDHSKAELPSSGLVKEAELSKDLVDLKYNVLLFNCKISCIYTLNHFIWTSIQYLHYFWNNGFLRQLLPLFWWCNVLSKNKPLFQLVPYCLAVL